MVPESVVNDNSTRHIIQDFILRRELTRAARRDLELLAPSQAVDVIRALEAEKKGHALQPADWSKIVSSRCIAKANAGEMDRGLMLQIDSFLQAPPQVVSFCRAQAWMAKLLRLFNCLRLAQDVDSRGTLMPDAVQELGATLRSLSSREAIAVLNDADFTASVPIGLVPNPAAAAQQIAKHMRRKIVEAKLLGKSAIRVVARVPFECPSKD